MAPNAMTKKRQENVEKVVEVVKAYGQEGITAKDMAELAELSLATVYNLQPMLGTHDIVCVPNVHGRRFVYKPQEVAKVEVKTEPKEEAKADVKIEPRLERKADVRSAFRNAEGYTDKTAGAAISGKTVIMDDFKVGGIYDEKYMVLKAFSDTLVYLEVIPTSEKPEYITDFCVRFDMNGREYYVNPHRIWTVAAYKVQKTPCYAINLSLFKQIAGLCGMNVVEVEKVVEKVVFKDRVVEVPAEDKDLQHKMELLEQKAEIWEKAFYAVTGKGA